MASIERFFSCERMKEFGIFFLLLGCLDDKFSGLISPHLPKISDCKLGKCLYLRALFIVNYVNKLNFAKQTQI